MKIFILFSTLLFASLLITYGQVTQLITTSGTWTAPAGVTSVVVECWGGGGAGGRSYAINVGAGGGGAGGAYARLNNFITVPGNTYTVTVGATKASSTTANAASNNDGNPTWFNSAATVFAQGGAGGAGVSTAANGAGGIGSSALSIGDVVRYGGNGADGNRSNGAAGGAGGGGAGSSGNGNNGVNGTGGAAVNDFGGAGANGPANNQSGAAGQIYGGGGAGGKRTTNPGTNRNGGAGAAGLIRLTYTCPTIIPTAGPNQTLASCDNATTLAGSAVPVGTTGTWTVFSGNATFTNPNSPTTTVTTLDLGVTNVLRWTINNGACGSFFADVSITTVIGPGCNSYCSPDPLLCTPNVTGGCGVQNFVIRNVTIGTLNNNSSINSCNADNGVNGYSDFTGLAAPTLLIGSTYNLSISVGSFTCGPTNAMVWFDFNGNGNWTDPGEGFLIGAMTSNGTTTIPITIPTNALEISTRMRVKYIYATTILSSYSCTSGAQAGETEDYTVNIQCSTTPSDVTGRFPANGLSLTCGSAANLIWDFHRCATGYEVYLSTTNPANTLITTINDPNTTQYYTGNLLDNTTYYWRIRPINGNGPGASSNWSFTTQTGIQTAISQDTSGCGEGGLTLTANGALPDYYWYNVPVNGTPIATGPTYSPIGLTGPTTFYVSNVLVGPAASIACGTVSTVVCSSAARGWGTTFDVQAKSANLNITGASVMFRNLGTGGTSNRPVRVYYRTNSYQGNAGNAAGWILVGNYTVNVPNSTTAPIFIDFADVFVPAAARYGFYIVYDQEYAPGANVYSNADIEVLTGASICGAEFGTVINDRSFRGTVFYNTNCSSPTIPVLATPYVSNSEVKLALNTVIAAEEQCTEGGWTYYADPAVPNDWLFAINKNGNTFTATVDIIESPTVYSNINTTAPHGSFLISRYWNVNMVSGSVVSPVGVRFFFDTAEIRAAFNMRNFERTTNYPSTFEVPWSWFKSVGAPFNPAVGIDGNLFTFNHTIPMGVNNNTLLGAYYSGYINSVPYVEFSGITSFSGGTGGFGFSTYENVALPVELLSFNGIEQNEFNHLFWSTASEINNDYFILESSTDGENFNDVTVMQGAGNSTQTNFYNFKDYNYNSPITYYRLKQVDYDGTPSYSNTIIINRTVSSSSMTITVFPNPTTGHLNVNTLSRFSGNAEIKVMNMIGELIYFDKKYLEEGLNNSVFDFSSLARGIYSIEVKTDMERKVIQFVKQ